MTTRNNASKPRRSEHPPPATADKAAKSSTSEGERHYGRRARRVLARYGATLSEPVRAYLLAAMSAEAARASGAARSPVEYFEELAGALDTFAPHILAKELKGYGPLRARYGAELLRDLAPSLVAYEGKRSAAKVAGGDHSRAMSLTDAQRAETRTALGCVLAGDEAASERLGATAPQSQKKRERIVAAEALVSMAERAKDDVPAELLADAGLSTDTLDALKTSARDASETGATRADEASAKMALRAGMAEVCGRIKLELRVLLGAVRAARNARPTMPRFTSKLLHHGRPRAAAPTPPARPAPKPADG